MVFFHPYFDLVDIVGNKRYNFIFIGQIFGWSNAGNMIRIKLQLILIHFQHNFRVKVKEQTAANLPLAMNQLQL